MLLGCRTGGIGDDHRHQCRDIVDHIDNIYEHHNHAADNDNVVDDDEHDNNVDYAHDDRATP